jgi:putative peptidoglycan lipid II flippase
MKNFVIVTFWSIVNKFLSLFRVQLTQKLLGASVDSDAFHLAFRMIGFFRRIFTDGSFYSFFTSYFARKDKDHQDKNFGFVLGVLLIFSGIFLIISLLFFLFPLPLTQLFLLQNTATPKILLISKYAKYMFPLALSMFFCSIFSAILNSYGEFFHSSLGLVLGSLCNVTILYFYKTNMFWAFVLGTLSYSTIHAIYMAIIIYRKYYSYQTPVFDRNFFKKISVTGVVQVINNIIFLLMGVLFVGMKSGGYSYVEYAERLSYFVFVLVAGNLSNVISPVLSKLKDNKVDFQKCCEQFFSMTMFLVIFPTVFMFVQHDIITRSIYTANAKTNLASISIALKYVALGTPFWCFQRILLTFFSSQGNLNQQNLCTFMYNMITLLMGVLLRKWDYLGIVWSMNIAIICVVIYLFYVCYKTDTFKITPPIIYDSFIKIMLSFFLMQNIFGKIFISTNMWWLLLKAFGVYTIYCLFCYKDIKFFSNQKNS